MKNTNGYSKNKRNINIQICFFADMQICHLKICPVCAHLKHALTHTHSLLQDSIYKYSSYCNKSIISPLSDSFPALLYGLRVTNISHSFIFLEPDTVIMLSYHTCLVTTKKTDTASKKET